jgi:hypothetical protein
MCAGATLLVGAASPAAAQETVSMTIPAGVSFAVTDASAATPGSPAPTVVAFTGGTWPPPGGRRFVISIRADAASFTPPAGGSIPASYVTWTASAASGTASGGTLSSSAFSQVYRSPTNTPSGSVSVTWELAALTPVSNLRAGNHSLTVRWRLELQ